MLVRSKLLSQMSMVETKVKRWKLREWYCCDNIWQLLLSSLFPERNKFQPLCPKCGTKGELSDFEIK